MQNKQVLLETPNKENKTVYLNDCTYENKRILFIPGNLNSLFEMDIEARNVNTLGKIPDENENTDSLYTKIIKFENDI
ncbi:hypothetical protein [Anaerocolumna sp. MB42-C2]|uniref:hypothetical protein n=1 Tax=Anaerocolumna sp. MB42-C2 TaxID=3070997 RepID=UPI0027DF7797|nr:hypothetical protein [Anaerocolumna sp. MB42-C2]WMJ90186.1 hypothetical protein RBU59_11865 [Anaerocolumna sp. MB42-C2]